MTIPWPKVSGWLVDISVSEGEHRLEATHQVKYSGPAPLPSGVRINSHMTISVPMADYEDMRSERDEARAELAHLILTIAEMPSASQIDRLLAAKDTQIAELNSQLAYLRAINPPPVNSALMHNPFREFPGDPRRMGP